MKSYHWLILLLSAALIIVSVRLVYVLSEKGDASEGTDSEAALECIMTRASVRDYLDKAVPDTIVEKILRAGMAAPTARNRQPWEFIVITDQTLKDSISGSFEYAAMVGKSAFDVVVCGNSDLWGDNDTPEVGNWVLDCSAATENMLLAAHALGLGGVWCGVYPNPERISRLSGLMRLPENLVPLNIVSFGYPAAEVTPKQKWDPAKVRYNPGQD